MSELTDSSVASQILCRTLRIRDYKLHRAIAEVVEDAVKDSGQTMEQVINRMQIQWENHRSNAHKLEWSFTYPEKFFFSPIWADEKMWPWKPGQEPRRAAVSEAKPQQWAINRWQMLKDNEHPMMASCPEEIRMFLK